MFKMPKKRVDSELFWHLKSVYHPQPTTFPFTFLKVFADLMLYAWSASRFAPLLYFSSCTTAHQPHKSRSGAGFKMKRIVKLLFVFLFLILSVTISWGSLNSGSGEVVLLDFGGWEKKNPPGLSPCQRISGWLSVRLHIVCLCSVGCVPVVILVCLTLTSKQARWLTCPEAEQSVLTSTVNIEKYRRSWVWPAGRCLKVWFDSAAGSVHSGSNSRHTGANQ